MQLMTLATLGMLCSIPLVAEDTPRARILLFNEHTTFRRSPVAFFIEGGQTYTTTDQPKQQNAWGLRFCAGLDDESKWNLELAVRSKKQSNLTYSGPISPSYTLDFSQDHLEYGWWGPGATYALKLGPVVSINAGLDLRIERLTYFLPVGTIVPEGYSETTIYDRPWARAAVTFTIPMSTRIKPQIGIEGAVALVRKKVKTYSATQYVDSEDMRRGLAPNNSLTFFAGIAF